MRICLSYTDFFEIIPLIIKFQLFYLYTISLFIASTIPSNNKLVLSDPSFTTSNPLTIAKLVLLSNIPAKNTRNIETRVGVIYTKKASQKPSNDTPPYDPFL